LRFSSRPPADYPPISSGVRRRLWALVALLGAVGWMMQHLQQPETVERLGRAFQLAPPPAGDARDAGERPFHADAADRVAVEPAPNAPLADGEDAARLPAAELAAAWAAVTDNAYFLPQEQAAWWALWERALAAREADASSRSLPASLGDASYVQLLQQPEAYRGQLVTVRGTAIRCEATRPAANALGLERLDRVWLAPAGGGEWPIVIYFAGLEPEFPRGAAIRVPLKVDGFFFKVWSYAHDGGLGLAPALVAARWTWQSAAPRADHFAAAPPLPWGWMCGGALALASCAVGWAVWATRRPRSNHRLSPPDAAAWSQLDHDQPESLASSAVESPPDAEPLVGDGQR
jgi:hypothetical protein